MIRAASLLLALALAAPHARAQPIQAMGRAERVLEADGLVTSRLASGGTVELRVSPPPVLAATGQWRFWISAPRAVEGAEIRDSASGQVLATLEAATLRRGGWSGFLRRGQVMIRLPAAAKPQVTHLSWPVARIDTQTPVGVTNLTRVADRQLPLAVQHLTQTVGRLSVVRGRDNRTGKEFVTNCTAFLVRSDLVLTAEHCVHGGIEGRPAVLALGYNDPQRPTGSGERGVNVRAVSQAEDLALLAIDPPAEGVKPVRFAVADASPGLRLMVLQHFQGDPMSISDDDDCRASASLFPGPLVFDPEGPKADVAFGHGCDTTVSSSGSPVFDRQSLEVVGLHHRGFSQGSETNRAVRVSIVAQFLAAAVPGWGEADAVQPATPAAVGAASETPLPPPVALSPAGLAGTAGRPGTTGPNAVGGAAGPQAATPTGGTAALTDSALTIKEPR